jgi:ribonucrease Y
LEEFMSLFTNILKKLTALDSVDAPVSKPERSSSKEESESKSGHERGKQAKQPKHPKPDHSQSQTQSRKDDASEAEARAKAREIVVEAKDEALKIRMSAEEEARKTKTRAMEDEKGLAVQRTKIDSKEREIEQKAKTLRMAKEVIERKQKEVEGQMEEQKKQLERVAALSKDEAREILLKKLDSELVEEKGKKIRNFEEELRRDTEKMAQEILLEAMEFGATDIVVEHSTSKVALPDNDLKGRIIGKEGRNIRAFEELTGVDLDLDAVPGQITISSFDSMRREVAKIALERLVADGRIQPARIEEIVEKTRKEVEKLAFKAGDDLCHKVGVYNLSRDVVQMLGKFKYRFSYGQNMIEHTLEVARLGMALSNKLGAKTETVKLGCLLHDIGKVITDEDGSHVDLAVEFLRKHKVSKEIIECVGEHHSDSHSSIEAAIVALADHISGTRPGSRGEDYESYVQRLKALEEAATSFDGVEKAYAVSAGREVRVFVSPERVDDASTALLAHEIAKKIELEQTYPGVVKVIVIRETRVIETAK